MRVTLREKKLKHGQRSLYLDFYPPIINEGNGKPTRREHLKLYIFEKPRTELEREHNKETKILGEHIRAKRQLEIQAGNYNFLSNKTKQKDFIQYIKDKAEENKGSSVYRHQHAVAELLKNFASSVRFADITPGFCEKFREYLLKSTKLKHNSASTYYSRFRAIINVATKENLLPESLSRKTVSIPKQETFREFVSLTELQTLAKTECGSDELKRAALFSALTGLRRSDLQKLVWSEIRRSDEQHGFYIQFRQKKTKGAEILPISEEAYSLLGTLGEADQGIFPNLTVGLCEYHLSDWIKKAGIDRHITFHSFRHSFATLQLSLGTDLFTVSKMLGHKDIKTTQIYAKILDEAKRNAANKITLK